MYAALLHGSLYIAFMCLLLEVGIGFPGTIVTDDFMSSHLGAGSSSRAANAFNVGTTSSAPFLFCFCFSKTGFLSVAPAVLELHRPGWS